MEKTSSEESVNSQELEETPQKRRVSLNVDRVRRAMRLIDEYGARPCLWPGTSCSRDFAHATAGELSSTIWNFFGRLTM